eukprot:854689-Pelagomonas_calceolata.AAC.1
MPIFLPAWTCTLSSARSASLCMPRGKASARLHSPYTIQNILSTDKKTGSSLYMWIRAYLQRRPRGCVWQLSYIEQAPLGGVRDTQVIAEAQRLQSTQLLHYNVSVSPHVHRSLLEVYGCRGSSYANAAFRLVWGSMCVLVCLTHHQPPTQIACIEFAGLFQGHVGEKDPPLSSPTSSASTQPASRRSWRKSGRRAKLRSARVMHSAAPGSLPCLLPRAEMSMAGI